MTDELIVQLERQADLRRVNVGGKALVWRRFGTGRPVVLIHGGHGSWLHWARNIEALAEHHSVWVPDLPGYGDSDLPTSDQLSELVDATQSSLAELIGPSTSVDLVGFSFGALVATHLAVRLSRNPEVRCRLGLLGPAGHGGRRRPRGELVNWHFAARSGDVVALQAAMRHNLAVHMLHAQTSIDTLALQIHTRSCQLTRFRSKAISRAGGLTGILGQFPGEVLIAWGEHDVTAEPAAAAAMLVEARSPNGLATRVEEPDVKTTVRLIPDAGHWVQYEAATEINRLLADWLGT